MKSKIYCFQHVTSFSKSATNPFLTFYPKMLRPHHHCQFPRKRDGQQMQMRKRSHPPVILQKENHRTRTEALRNPALMQARMAHPYMGACTHKYTHISVTQGEGNVSRGTCSECPLHKSSMATCYKIVQKGRRPLLTGQAGVTEPECHPHCFTRQQCPLQPASIHAGSGTAINAHMLSCND